MSYWIQLRSQQMLRGVKDTSLQKITLFHVIYYMLTPLIFYVCLLFLHCVTPLSKISDSATDWTDNINRLKIGMCLTIVTINLRGHCSCLFEILSGVIHMDCDHVSVHLQLPFRTEAFPDLLTVFPVSIEIRETESLSHPFGTWGKQTHRKSDKTEIGGKVQDDDINTKHYHIGDK